MTRISSGVRAKELCDIHLRKERIEIVRIPNSIKNKKAVIKNIPKNYRLGIGHVKFFYDKLLYLEKRYFELTYECKKRGFNTTDFSNSFKDLPGELYKDWKENKEAREITKARINERIKSMKEKDLKFYGKNVSFEFLKIH